MIVNHHSRKQRQLKTLVKHLNNLLKNADFDLKSEIKKIVAKIKYLVSQLNGIVSTNRIKRILGGIALLIGISFTNTASAQWFAYPIQDPFNLQDGYDTQVNSVEFADIDNDGDYDFLSGEYNYSPIGYGYSLGFQFQENTGSVTNPNFSTPPTSNTYGLISYSPSLPSVAIYQWFKMIDLDNDGDFDILSNVVHQNINQYSINTDFLYYENTGSATNPQFSIPQTNPFGLNSSPAILHTAIGDIDGDGDLDLLGFYYDPNISIANSIFIENIGTASAPIFNTPQLNQFGLPSSVFSLITLEDIDTDGDLDIFFADEDYNPYMSSIAYVENTGTAIAPQFSPPPTANPFGLTFPSNWQGIAILNFKDLDGDNDNDLIAGTDDEMNLYFENVGVPQPATYECINYSCVDPGTGSGSYSTLSACQTNCTAPVTFECDWPGNCYDPGDGSGWYTTYADCMVDCAPQPTWDCVAPGNCQDPGDESGNHWSLQDCQNACGVTPTWDCETTLGCIDPGTGAGLYTSLAGCQSNCNSTSIENTEVNNLKIYPNPVNNTLNISSDNKIKKIEIYDALSRVIYAESNPSSAINVEQLESGLYSIAIIFDDNRIVKKFTK
tara:strand:+ start:766 stop:2595 length:1830 start_codon:yes stop_codon:yes gene_type:complete